MATDDDFGPELRRLRKAAGYSSTEKLAAHVARQTGIEVSGAAIGQWERGEVGNPDRQALSAVEQAIGSDGALVAMLSAPPPITPARTSRRLDAHEARLVDIEERLAALEGEGATTSRRPVMSASLNVVRGTPDPPVAIAASRGGVEHEAPPPDGVSDRPLPPPVEPDVDPPSPDDHTDPEGPETGA